MRMKQLGTAFAALFCGAALLLAQKQPQPKSQKEIDAIMAIQNATTPDARIAAADNLLTKFADTEFKSYALRMMAFSAQEKGDYDKMIVYAERTLEADPKDYQAMLLISKGLAQRTREFDLDKEEKLTKAEKYANDAMGALKTAAKPGPQVSDEQWAAVKKDSEADVHETLAQIAGLRKKYDVAINEYKTAVDLSTQPNPVLLARMGQTYTQAGKYDEALATFDKVSAMPNVPDQVKSFVTQQREAANKAKAAAKK